MLIGNHVIECDDYYIRELPSGVDELNFTISVYSPSYGLISEEDVITEDGVPYLVKAIDAGQNTVQIKALLDLDEWKATVLTNYTLTGTPATIIGAVNPTGWTVTDNSAIATSTSLEIVGATPFDILSSLREKLPSLAYRFDPKSKTLTLRNQLTGSYVGAYLSRQLNLHKIEYKGKSTQFATRLYATGKDGMTFASINNGKAYVDNNMYSDKVVCAYMQDERYEDTTEAISKGFGKAGLLAAATTQLQTMCVPQRSYTCDAVDLAKIKPEEYAHLSYELFSKVDLIDDMRDTKIQHTIVEYWRYPKKPEKNKVVLSTSTPRIQSQVQALVYAVNNPNSEWQERQNALQDTLTAIILGAKGGSVRLLDTNNDGEPDTLYIADSPDLTTAQVVWRFNYAGWGVSTNGYNGQFTSGMTFENGGTLYANILKVVNINASNISTGTLDASVITVKNLNADEITVGTLHTSSSVGISGYITVPRTFSIVGSPGTTITGAGCTNFETTGYLSSAGSAFFKGGQYVYIGRQTLDAYVASIVESYITPSEE